MVLFGRLGDAHSLVGERMEFRVGLESSMTVPLPVSLSISCSPPPHFVSLCFVPVTYDVRAQLPAPAVKAVSGYLA